MKQQLKDYWEVTMNRFIVYCDNIPAYTVCKVKLDVTNKIVVIRRCMLAEDDLQQILYPSWHNTKLNCIINLLDYEGNTKDSIEGSLSLINCSLALLSWTDDGPICVNYKFRFSDILINGTKI